MMIGRWPTLLLLLSVYNTIYTNIFFLSKVLFCFCVCSLFFSLFFFLSILGISLPLRQIVFKQPLSTAKASDDTRRKLDQSFSPRSECYECSSSLSLSFQKERERDHNIHSYILFCDRKQKPSNRSSFSTNTGCFCTKKKRRHFFKSLNARKFSRIKHTRFKKKNNNKSAEQRERKFRLFLVSSRF